MGLFIGLRGDFIVFFKNLCSKSTKSSIEPCVSSIFPYTLKSSFD